MIEREIAGYQRLNDLADGGGVVILGGSRDLSIPLCELRQAFCLEEKLYNRSVTGLSVMDALRVYEECIAPLSPDTVLLHIGEEDLPFFREDGNVFDEKYCELISHIRKENKKCRIGVVSLKNYGEDPLIGELNQHLRNIADSEQCTYGDISRKKVWNPRSTREAAAFVASMGFVRPLKYQRSLHDLVKMLFGFPMSE